MVSRLIDLNLKIPLSEAKRWEGKKSEVLEKEIAELVGQREALRQNIGLFSLITSFEKEVMTKVENEPANEDFFCQWDKKMKQSQVKKGLLAPLSLYSRSCRRNNKPPYDIDDKPKSTILEIG